MHGRALLLGNFDRVRCLPRRVSVVAHGRFLARAFDGLGAAVRAVYDIRFVERRLGILSGERHDPLHQPRANLFDASLVPH